MNPVSPVPYAPKLHEEMTEDREPREPGNNIVALVKSNIIRKRQSTEVR